MAAEIVSEAHARTVPSGKPLADREAAVLAGEQAADRREDSADRREQTADQREVSADQRQETADLRHEAADLRQEAADLRQAAADTSDQEARAKAELSEVAKAQLREANERLVVATVRAQTMSEAAERIATQMSFMAEHDFLTGLPNRSLLSDRLAQSIARARRRGNKVALLYIDLDHFKRINDSLGHAAGDQLLQLVARRLQSCVRLSDTVCRQGGDEFVVLLADVEAASDATLAAEKLIGAMVEPFLIGDDRLHITLSIGISLYPDDGDDVETVLRNADIAMYHAKKSGRNKHKVFASRMNVRAVARQSIQQALHNALEKRQFVLHYQPKVNLETGVISGVEALVRMRDGNQRLVLPAKFVSVAEESGLILPLGRWVLREACRQMQAWLGDGVDIGQIAVNVSAFEFRNPGFLAGVRDILAATGLDPGRLEIELTESGLMQDTETTTRVLSELKRLGVSIAIDDFGTGYSSLSYLRRFPIDTIKIDQSFVKDIDADSEEAVIVSAIIGMGKSLKLRVVAEGVETAHQLAFLRAQQCAEGQGFYFNQPLSPEQLAITLRG